jgi:hypothetical protein
LVVVVLYHTTTANNTKMDKNVSGNITESTMPCTKNTHTHKHALRRHSARAGITNKTTRCGPQLTPYGNQENKM